MDPRFLRTFVTVARLGSFSAAARELGYTQSAVSQHIGVLEADLGAPLLTRRPVEPTEAGARLLEHAEPILLRLDAARADVAKVAGGPPRSLRIGTTPLACGHAASLVAPALTVTVRVADRVTIAREVATGVLDVGFVDGVAAVNDPLRLPELGLTVAEVWEEPLAVAVPADHPLIARTVPGIARPSSFSRSTDESRRSRPAVRLEDLVDARWIDAPVVCAPLDELAAIARADGFRPALHYDGADVSGLLALVAAGHGLALLPRRVVTHGLALAEPALTHRTELLRLGG
ncbi:LysR family transcriptional regulator [Solirubrobacter ginsenosidimutans]|uniref:LysR family transcriptional regulator n=1 Tax=Solirubrobacter ginsenosidimutans TaxID=490573 RepID=A0A9X3RYL8_9ACTN|nr:LysR family transcriptional regulator [Solirubrobacter ginsenosidimutans]MDA0159314.1 LysR family transcriptional regulator [Solirubrobacter ginsenosidimutans]